MLLYAVTIFLSAFLLFQIEPIIAKSIVPWFGGSAAVWTTCLLFFQLVLLGGYLYAHGTIRYLQPKMPRRGCTSGCWLVSLLALHVLPRAEPEADGGRGADAGDPAAAAGDRRPALPAAVHDRAAAPGLVRGPAPGGSGGGLPVPAVRTIELRVPAGPAVLPRGDRAGADHQAAGVDLVGRLRRLRRPVRRRRLAVTVGGPGTRAEEGAEDTHRAGLEAVAGLDRAWPPSPRPCCWR